MFTLCACVSFLGAYRQLSRGCSALIAVACLTATIVLCATAVQASDVDLSGLYAQRPLTAATDAADVDVANLYSRRSPMAVAPAADVDLSCLRARRAPQPDPSPAADQPPKPQALPPQQTANLPTWHTPGTTYRWQDGFYRNIPQPGLTYFPPPRLQTQSKCYGKNCPL